jgi:polyisoprenoid-binding protein YceI
VSVRILSVVVIAAAVSTAALSPVPAAPTLHADNTGASSASEGAAESASLVTSQQKVALRYEVSGEGNKARYRVRERLVGKELDNDAVGETPKVTGTIALDDKGKIVASESFFTASLAELTSDAARRDNYVRRRLLVTDTFPTTTLRITEVRGLPSPLPKSGEAKFQLVGDLTVKGVTRPTTWNVNASLKDNVLRGTAATRFTFAEFNLTQPRVSVVLSVADTIGLEYDFVMTKK